jgi:hypothetical protein
MPNLCTNHVDLYCNNKASAERLCNTILNVTTGKNWELHELEEYFQLKPNVDAPQPNMRSWINDVHCEDCVVKIQSDSAWNPAVGIFREMANQLAFIESIEYCSCEPGWRIFQTGDECYADEMYWVDMGDHVEDLDWVDTRNFLCDFIYERRESDMYAYKTWKLIEADKESFSMDDLIDAAKKISVYAGFASFGENVLLNYIDVNCYDYIPINQQS